MLSLRPDQNLLVGPKRYSSQLGEKRESGGKGSLPDLLGPALGLGLGLGFSLGHAPIIPERLPAYKHWISSPIAAAGNAISTTDRIWTSFSRFFDFMKRLLGLPYPQDLIYLD